jgi:dihydroorotase
MPSTVAGTITVHHLTMTLEDVIVEALRPHHFVADFKAPFR